MDFELSEERRLLQETVSRFVRDRYSIETRHEFSASQEGFSREMWADFAELGLIGALIPDEAGGFGGAGADICVVMEELGRGLVVEPFLATGVLGAGVLMHSEREEHQAVLDDVIAGKTLLALAHGEPGNRYELNGITTTASQGDGSWQLSGHKSVVMNGDTADYYIVSTRYNGEHCSKSVGLFLVGTNEPGIELRGYATVDGGRAADVTLSDVRVGDDSLIAEGDAAAAILESAIGRGVLALCAEATGIMETIRDMTLDYLKTRKQFGVPLGKFQALQHRMVDICLEIEQARSVTMLAASRLSASRNEREAALSAAKNLIGRTGKFVAEEAIQLHGGIGMTWEYALAHYAKRLVMIDHQLGDTDFHLNRFIQFSSEAA